MARRQNTGTPKATLCVRDVPIGTTAGEIWILKLLLTRQYWVRLAPVVSDLLTGEYGEISEEIFKYHRAGGGTEVLELKTLNTLLQERRSSARFENILKALKKLPKILPKRVEDYTLNFVVRSGLQYFVAHVALMLEDSTTVDLWDVKSKLAELCSVQGTDEEKTTLYSATSCGASKVLLEGRVSTGFPTLDARLSGGPGPGELALVLAPTGGGKTALLQRFCKEGVLTGHKVVNVSLEIGKAMMVARYNMMFTNCSFSDSLNKAKVSKKLNKILRASKGELVLVDFMGQPSTVQQVEHLIEAEADKSPVGLVVVDYVNKLKSTSKYGNRSSELEQIADELRNMAQRTKVPVWTAAQVNRAGSEKASTGGWFNRTNVGESWGLIQGADATINVQQARREQDCLCLEVDKTRFSSEGAKVYVRVDYDYMQIEEQ